MYFIKYINVSFVDACVERVTVIIMSLPESIFIGWANQSHPLDPILKES